MRIPVLTAAVAALCLSAGCSMNPEVAKKKYVDRGNVYFEKGKYKEAMIMYRNALKKDPKYGEAYYRAALTELKMDDSGAMKIQAARDLHRAAELQPDNMDAYERLVNIYLELYLQDQRHPKIYVTELKTLQDKLAKRNPKSYQVIRLSGYLALTDNKVKDAITYFQQANTMKPLQPDVVLILMQSMQSDGRYADAEKLAYEVLNKDPRSTAMYDALFITYLKTNRLPDAERILKTKIEKIPENEDNYLQLAAHYFSMRRQQEMNDTLNRLLSDPKKFPNGYKKVGDFYLRVRDLDSAGRIYREGIAKFPNDKAPYQKALCEVLAGQGKYKEAQDLVAEILRATPNDDEAFGIRASLKLASGNKDDAQAAIGDLQTLLSRMPRERTAVVRYNLGRGYLLRGNQQQAKIQYEEAMQIRPDYLQPRIALAELLLQSRDYGRVMQLSGEVLAIDPRNVPARLLRTRGLIGLGDYNQARTELKQVAAQYPDVSEAQLQLAAVDAASNNHAAAEATYKTVIAKTGDMRAVVGLSETYLMADRVDDAIAVLRDELARHPKNTKIHILLGNVAMRSKRWDMAVNEYREELKTNPREGETWVRLGEAYRAKNDGPAAMDSFKKASELVPNNSVPFVQLGMLYDELGKRDESKKMYEQVLRLDPENPFALNNLAFAMAELGSDLDQALTMAQRARQKLPQNQDVADTLGWVYLKKNMSDSAIDIFRGIVRQKPDRALYRYHLGLALAQKGNKPEARKELETALRSKPQKEEEVKIRELIAKLG